MFLKAAFKKENLGSLTYIIPPIVGGHPCRPTTCFEKKLRFLKTCFGIAFLYYNPVILSFRLVRNLQIMPKDNLF